MTEDVKKIVRDLHSWNVYGQSVERCNTELAAADLIEHLSVEQDALVLEIEKLRTELESAKYGWISVEDRLPELGERVIVLNKWGHVNDKKLRKDLYGDKIARFAPDGLLPGKDVTHWMPMPEPPKEEE